MKKATANNIPFLIGDMFDKEYFTDLTKDETLKIIPDTDNKDSILPKTDELDISANNTPPPIYK